MDNFKKEYVVIGSLLIIAICVGVTKVTASSPARSTAIAAVSHDPFVVSSSDSSTGESSDDNNLHIGPISIPMPTIMGIFGGFSSSSPEQDAEDDILTETAMSIALPDNLISHMSDIKPFLKLLVRNKRSSPKIEEQDVLGALRRASSHQKLPSRDRPIPSDMPENSSVVRSAFRSDDSLEDEMTSERLHTDIQRERIKIQQLLLEASRAALDAKESELGIRARIILEKEKKLEQKFSKKYAAGIATVSSLLTTLIGTLTAYYSSK